MSHHETNIGNGLNTGVEPESGLPGSSFNFNRDLFGQPLSKEPGAIDNPLSGLEKKFNPALSSDDALIADETQPDPTASTTGEEGSGFLLIDSAAQQVNRVLDRFDEAVETSTPIVSNAVQQTISELSETIRSSIDTARNNWNAPDNEIHNALSHWGSRATGFMKTLTANLSANPRVREIADTAIELGRNLADKTENVIQTTQAATETWVDTLFDATYTATNSGNYQGNHHRHNQPFVGVIDTGFAAQEHGAQVVEAIRRISHHTPSWLGEGVGTGDWADALVQFVDAARASGQTRAIVNLSFDLTQTNPDGSVTTRHQLTASEQAALTYARDQGVLIVASSGNQGGLMSALGQASQQFDNIITVGASENGQRADYSSYGQGLNLVTSGYGNSGTEGTSFSTAKVTAAVLQVWQANAQLDYRRVIHALEATAIDLQKPGWDQETGAGQLNTQAAIDQAKVMQSDRSILSNSQLFQTADFQTAESHPSSSNGLNAEQSWSGLEDAIPSERSTRLVAGDGLQPEPTSSGDIDQTYQPSNLPASADGAERWSEALQNRESYTIRPGDTLSAIAQQKLGDGNRWTEIQKEDGSKFTATEAGKLQVGETVFLPATGTSSTTSTTSETSPYQGMSADAAEQWAEADQNRQTYTIKPNDTLSAIAQRLWGDGSRWTEIEREDGSTFTEEETSQLRVGMEVFLPDISSSPTPSDTESSAYRGMSADAAERWSESASNRGTEYVIQAGDTLSTIAQQQLGDSNRWREITKEDGTPFAEAEARQLQAGATVYLPIDQQHSPDPAPDSSANEGTINSSVPSERSVNSTVPEFLQTPDPQETTAYNSLYENEFNKLIQPTFVNPLVQDRLQELQNLYELGVIDQTALNEYLVEIYMTEPSIDVVDTSTTTWGMEDRYGSNGAKEMLQQYKDFLKEAAEYYGIDGRAIAGAIRWEYEENGASWLQQQAYEDVQSDGDFNLFPQWIPVLGGRPRAVGWGAFHYDVAQDTLEKAGEEVLDDRELATRLALPPSAIDFIAKHMQQAAQTYYEIANVDISHMPGVLATLYHTGRHEEKAREFAEARKTDPSKMPQAGDDMGLWVQANLDSLAEFQTT